MKKYILLILALLMIPAGAIEAQSKKKGKKQESPIIEGRQKVRKTDYEQVWKFTTFNVKKKKTMYYCDFNYMEIPEMAEQKKPNWKEFQPVVNHLKASSKTAMTIVAIYAINPDITDDAQRAALADTANLDALQVLADFDEWRTYEGIKNKMNFRVAQVDFRYWYGNDFFTMEKPTAALIPVGFVIALTNKKVDLFPNPAASAQKFNDVKFFPNDATVVESYLPMIDSLATYVMSNDRYEVCLTGYSDNTGTRDYNRGLSNQRANEIKKMLMQRGVPSYRIEIIARGENDPIGDNNTYEGRIANNRVSIKIQ